MDAPGLALDLALPAGEAAALRRRLGGALGRGRALGIVWHDDASGSLARAGLAIGAWREGRTAGWRAEALDPVLPPGAPAPVLAEAASASGLSASGSVGVALPERLQLVQRLEGRVRAGLSAAVALRLMEGRLDDGTQVVRLRLTGPLDEVMELGLSLAGELHLSVPVRSLAMEALARAGMMVPERRLGAPGMPAGLAPGAAFGHAAGHLLGVLLHHAPPAMRGQTGEPVHQMRVALRRLRALAAVFRDVVDGPELGLLGQEIKHLATALGPARDWDVFLDGTGRCVREAFPHEPELDALLAGAEGQRAAAYAALRTLLEGPALRRVSVQAAALVLARPWDDGREVPQDTAAFGAALLARRLRRLARQADGLEEQSAEALHELRLKAKRLRYAAEAFAPLHPGREARRFLNRLATLQDALGHLNDGAVAAELMQALGGHGGTGLAGGLVRGFVAGRAVEARGEIGRAWKRLRKAKAFWA